MAVEAATVAMMSDVIDQKEKYLQGKETCGPLHAGNTVAACQKDDSSQQLTLFQHHHHICRSARTLL